MKKILIFNSVGQLHKIYKATAWAAGNTGVYTGGGIIVDGGVCVRAKLRTTAYEF